MVQTPVGANAATLAGLQMQMLDLYRNGQLNLRSFERFLNMPPEIRNGLVGARLNVRALKYPFIQLKPDYPLPNRYGHFETDGERAFVSGPLYGTYEVKSDYIGTDVMRPQADSIFDIQKKLKKKGCVLAHSVLAHFFRKFPHCVPEWMGPKDYTGISNFAFPLTGSSEDLKEGFAVGRMMADEFGIWSSEMNDWTQILRKTAVVYLEPVEDR